MKRTVVYHTLFGVAALCCASASMAQTRSFSLNVQALQDKDKKTDVILTATPTDGGTVPTSLKQVQLKSFDTAGTLRWTKNTSDLPATGSPAVSTLSYTDMLRYQPVQAQVLIQTDATTKTEVYKDKIPVLLRPDLVIDELKAPAKVELGQIVNITASLREANADLDAKSVKLTLKNGAATIDNISGVFVKKGGKTDVVFSTKFMVAGNYTLTASIDGMTPAEFDTTNNTKTVSIEAVKQNTTYYYMAYNSMEQNYQYQTTAWWNTGTFYSEKSIGKFEDAYIVVQPAEVLTSTPTFPVKLEYSMGVDNNAPAIPLTSASLDKTYSYTDGCYSAEVGATYTNGVTLYTQFYTYCGGGSYAYSYIRSQSADYTYFSEAHDSNWNVLWSYVTPTKYGKFLNPQSSVQARLVATSSNGITYGGSGQISSIYTYPFDYSYTDAYTTYFNKGTQMYGYSSGLTAP